jgi:transposase-like protein
MKFLDFQTKFPTEEHVIQHFLNIRYPSTICCNHCGSIAVARRRDKKKVFRCSDCKNDFSIFKDTMFEDTYTDLRKWVYAIHLFINDKKGISGLQLQREIGGSYKTSWRMLHKIRTAMGNSGEKELFEAIVEIDETYMGGKPRKGNKRNGQPQEKLKRGRGTNKTPVVGIIDRDSKQVHAKVALPNERGEKLTGNQLLAILKEATKDWAVVMTDEFKGYNILDKEDSRFIRLKIDHTAGYVDGIVHTNGIESFWSLLKRGHMGTYHYISVKWLQNYVHEFSFRHNNRKNPGIFDLILKQGIASQPIEIVDKKSA